MLLDLLKMFLDQLTPFKRPYRDPRCYPHKEARWQDMDSPLQATRSVGSLFTCSTGVAGSFQGHRDRYIIIAPAVMIHQC